MTEAVYTATAEYIVEMEQRPVKHRVSVSGVLKRLGVSRSGYHAWKKRCPSAAEKHRGEVKEKILKVYEDSHQNYGAPKITRELWKGGEKIAVKTVANYMRQMGIKAQWIKPYTRTTIDSDFSRELHNILNEQFNPEQPDAVWVSDITYIWTFDGFVYLTSIMDLYSRKIIAWVLSETLEASHVVDCVEKAKKIRSITQPLIIHTDYAEEKTMPKNLITSCILIIRIQFFGIVFRVSQARRLLSLYQRSSTAFRHRQLWEQTC